MAKIDILQFFAATAVVFLTAVAILFNSPSAFYIAGVPDIDVARSSTYGCLFAYVLVSIYCVLYKKFTDPGLKEVDIARGGKFKGFSKPAFKKPESSKLDDEDYVEMTSLSSPSGESSIAMINNNNNASSTNSREPNRILSPDDWTEISDNEGGHHKITNV